MKNTFVKIHRNIIHWEWYKNANTARLFIHLIIVACFADYRFAGRDIKRGSVITSYPRLSSELNLSIQELRTAIKHLKSTGEISVITTSQYSIITVNKYDEYQKAVAPRTDKPFFYNSQTTPEKQPENSLSTGNQQQYKNIENINNENNVKKGRKGTHPFGRFENVFLYQIEVDRLKEEYPHSYLEKIEKLSCYLESSGKEYRNHYAKLVEWLEADADKDAEKIKPRKSVSYDIAELEKIQLPDGF